MLDFITHYWQYISFVLVFILNICILIFKRRSKCEILDSSVITQLMQLIVEAEHKYVSGYDKKNYVIQKFKESNPYLVEQLKKDFYDHFSSMRSVDSVISNLIEFILSTPQKKSTDD